MPYILALCLQLSYLGICSGKLLFLDADIITVWENLPSNFMWNFSALNLTFYINVKC